MAFAGADITDQFSARPDPGPPAGAARLRSPSIPLTDNARRQAALRMVNVSLGVCHMSSLRAWVLASLWLGAGRSAAFDGSRGGWRSGADQDRGDGVDRAAGGQWPGAPGRADQDVQLRARTVRVPRRHQARRRLGLDRGHRQVRVRWLEISEEAQHKGGEGHFSLDQRKFEILRLRNHHACRHDRRPRHRVRRRYRSRRDDGDGAAERVCPVLRRQWLPGTQEALRLHRRQAQWRHQQPAARQLRCADKPGQGESTAVHIGKSAA